MFIIFCYNDDGNTFYYYVCITYLFHFFSCDLSFFSVAIVSFFCSLLFHYTLYFFLLTRMYVARRVLDAFRRIFHYDCATFDVIFCCFERSFRIASMVRFFLHFSIHNITFIILFLYFAFLFRYYFVNYFVIPAYYHKVDCTVNMLM